MATQMDLDLQNKISEALKKTFLDQERVNRSKEEHFKILEKIKGALGQEEAKTARRVEVLDKRRAKLLEGVDKKNFKRQSTVDKHTRKINREHKKGVRDIGKAVDEIRVKHEKVQDISERFNKTATRYITNEREYQKAIDYRIQQHEELLDLMKKEFNVSDEEIANAKKQARSESNIARIRKDLLEDVAPGIQPKEQYREDIRKRVSKMPQEDAARFAKDKKLELGKEMGSAVKGAFSRGGGIKGFLESAKAIGDVAKKNKVLTQEMKAMGGGAAKAAGTFGMLGTAMESLGRIGWIGLIISSVAAIAKAVNAANKLITGLNVSYTQMQGPTVAIKGVKDSMRVFTDALYNMQRNLDVGLNAEEVTGLFKAMAGGGMSLQGVGKRITGGYGEAVRTAADLSKDFGVDVSEMGGMIADQMINMNSSLKEVGDSFQTLSYDATIAGISSQKFYEATMAASDSLSYYGNYLKSSSALLKTFSQAGAMGFKEASKQAQSFMTLFEGMDATKRMGLITVAGEDKVRALLKERSETAGKEEQAAQDDINKLKEQAAVTVDAQAKAEVMRQIGAKEEERATKQRIRLATEAGAKGDIMAMQAALPYIADKSADLIQSALKSMKLDLFNPNDILAASKSIEQLTGLSSTAITEFATTMQVSLENAEKARDAIRDGLSAAKEGTAESLDKILSKYTDKIASGEAIDLSTVKEDLDAFVKAGNSIGMSTEQFVKNFETNAYLVSDAVRAAAGKTVLTKDDVKLAVGKNISKLPVFKMNEKDAKRRREEIRNQTMSYEKMLGITAESAKYMAAIAAGDIPGADAVNQAIIGTASSAAGILNFLLKTPETKTGEAREKDPVWQKAVTAQAELIKAQEEDRALRDKYNEAEKKAAQAKGRAHGAETKYGKNSKEWQAAQAEATKLELAKKSQKQANVGPLAKLQNTQIKLQKELDKKIKEGSYGGSTLDLLEAANKKLGRGAASATTESATSSPGYTPYSMSPAQVSPLITPTNEDHEALTDGFVKVKAGDLTIDSDSLAMGISAGAGQMTSKLIGPGGFSGTGTTVTVPISLTIGSVNGDVNDLVRKIQPAIEQSFTRMFFERDKKG
jgi:hypothetical protein